MSRFELIAYRSWYGPFRKPLRAIARRVTDKSSRIVWGPLKGRCYSGQELSCRLGIYELHVQYALEELLSAGETFYDVGANNGYLSLLGAQCVGESGMVYSFEPLPHNARCLEALMIQNRIDHYRLVQQAVSSRSGTIEFYQDDKSDSYTPSLIRNRRNRVIDVRTTTLDDFVVGHRQPDLIKMDIEGAEVMALVGATQLLAAANGPKWVIEIHSRENDQEVRRILLNHGYRLQTLPPPFPRRPYPSHLIALKEA